MAVQVLSAELLAPAYPAVPTRPRAIREGNPCVSSYRTQPHLVKALVNQISPDVNGCWPDHHAALHKLALRGTGASLLMLLLLLRLRVLWLCGVLL